MMEKRKNEHKIYYAVECCIFRKTKEQYGGLSNMASGFPLLINNTRILSSEALYQACRFPHLPDIQKKIISEKSPMTAKMVSKPYRVNSRPDWNENRVKIMRWCLRIKLAQNFISFGKILESTFDKNIVEDSIKDDFWGAIRDKKDPNIIKGTNALGRLLMELRQLYNEKRYNYETFVIEPLEVPDFTLFGEPIRTVDVRELFISGLKKEMNYNESVNSNIDTNKSLIEEPKKFTASTFDNIEVAAHKPSEPSKSKINKPKSSKKSNKTQISLPF